jgi:tRNA pseudouridine38-40 synthase
MLRTFKLAIAYDGTTYGGWQLQPNKVTVQELLEKALAKMAGKRVVVHGSGRTDAGVHAREQIASCAFATHLAPSVLVLALNANLPEDVRVLRVQEVSREFHARFSAKGKEYRYQIDTGKVADPFQRRYAWHHSRHLSVGTMRRAAKLMIGRHDFSALSANPMREIETPVRRVTKLTITRRGNLLTVAVSADGFLYKMVRSMVGALVKVGEGKLSVEQLRALMAGKKRTALVETAPAHGLFLWKVFY